MLPLTTLSRKYFPLIPWVQCFFAKPQTSNLKPQTPKPKEQSPKSQTSNPKPQFPHPRPQTPNPNAAKLIAMTALLAETKPPKPKRVLVSVLDFVFRFFLFSAETKTFFGLKPKPWTPSSNAGKLIAMPAPLAETETRNLNLEAQRPTGFRFRKPKGLAFGNLKG